MTEDKRRVAIDRAESRRDAAALLAEGIRINANDPDFAKLSFMEAHRLFSTAEDSWNAHIAKRWLEQTELAEV